MLKALAKKYPEKFATYDSVRIDETEYFDLFYVIHVGEASLNIFSKLVGEKCNRFELYQSVPSI